MVQALVGGLAYLAFIKFNRFGEVRTLVRDVALDMPPGIARVVGLLA